MLRTCTWILCVIGLSVGFTGAASAQVWIDWQEVTSTNLVAAPNLGLNDVEEKDYIVGDFDQDGDPDVICVRKLPFTSFGPRTNVLFMNVSGVLTDMTATLCPDFLTPDNARDVMTGDFDGDGWIDFVVGNAGNDGNPGQQPRIFMNLGVNGSGQWQGFDEEASRLPVLFGPGGVQPNVCAVGVGDVTGNGVDDVYIVDYNNTMEDKLLINNGSGIFTDQTTSRLSTAFVQSAFGTAGMIVDVNADGFMDIVKDPQGGIRVAYNDGTGNFSVTQELPVSAAYHFDVGDLNNDGKNDVFSVQDGQDKYLINNSAPGAAPVAWGEFATSVSPLTAGFGGNVHIVDLDSDGDSDVVVADTDTDVSGCSRRLAFLRNNGATPNPSIQDPYTCQPGGGAGCLPLHQAGTHDVAVADFNLDGAPDILIGHCTGTRLFFQVPPVPPVLPISALTCTQMTLDVALSWNNGQAYDALTVRRDGVIVANLSGAASSYTDLAPSAGNHSYSIVGSSASLSSAPISCVVFVSTVTPATNVTCVQFDADVQLQWQNGGGVGGGSYANVEVRRGGDLIALLPGNAQQYLDVGPPLGLALYSITGVIGGDSSAQASCVINVAPTNATDLVLDFTQDDAGATPSAGAIAEALGANARVVNLAIVSSVTELLTLNIDMDDFERVWVELGTFPNNKVLSPAEGTLLANYVTNGVGGSDLYLSGGDTFFFDPQTALHGLLALDATADGFGSVANVQGVAAANCDLSSFTTKVFNGEDDSVDRLVATGTGESILRANVGGNQYFTGVFTDVPNGGAIIAQSCELGGIGAPHDRQDLVLAYLHCFPSGFPPPVASFTASPMSGVVPLTVNFTSTSTGFVDSATWLFGDGGIAVGNSVTHTYFVPGSFEVSLTVDGPGGTDILSVPDAVTVFPMGVLFIRGDANSDGSLNIGDAVAMLDYLFGGGSVTCEKALDANDDGSLNVADAIRVLSHLFSGSGPLPAPFPTCNGDPTSDSLTCLASSCP
ncbi:MAG: FG-GAP-like repeat-containing protein [Planctomycetota bacterium]